MRPSSRCLRPLCRLAVAAVAILTSLIVSTEPVRAQDAPSPTERAARAEQLLQTNEPERAAIELWSLAHDLDPDANDAVTESLRLALTPLLARADPLHVERRALRVDVAKQLLALARGYQRRKWLVTADQLLDLAARYDLATVEKARSYVKKKLGPARPTADGDAAGDAAAETAADELAPFARFEEWFSHGDWTIADDTASSPPFRGESLLTIAKNYEIADERYEFEMRLAPVEGGSSLIFGATAPQDYFLLEMQQWASTKSRSLFVHAFQGAGGDRNQPVETLARLDFVPSDDEQRASWVAIELEVRGREIRFGPVHGTKKTCVLHRPAHGRVGMLVSAGEPRPPTRFRKLRILPLPAAPEPVGGGAARANPDDELTSRINDAIAAGNELAESGRSEDAFHALRAVAFDIDRLQSDAVRTALRASLTERVEALDPMAGERPKIAAALATAFVTLADRYVEKDRVRSAVRLLVEARQLTREGVDARLAELRTMLQVQPETLDDATVDNRALAQWFGGGRTIWGSSKWSVEEAAGATSPEFREHAIGMYSSSRGATITKSVRVEAKLDGDGGLVGLAFGQRGPNEMWMLSWRPHETQESVQLLRLKDGTWSVVADADVDFATAARTGWTTLSVEVEDGKLTARVGNAAPLVLDVVAPISGTFGLVVEGRVHRITRGRYRNFAVRTD